jgi:hypothetical protein
LIAIITSLVTVFCVLLAIALKIYIIPIIKYNKAIQLYKSENYDEAISAFSELNGFKDSKAQIENCYIKKLGEEKYNYIQNIKIGDTYTFGSYEQDNDISNGKEPIEWTVLDKDGMTLLLISKYCLDHQYFTSYSPQMRTWETCTLRTWLNETFFNDAFTSEEQRRIIDSTVPADDNPYFISTSQGNDTKDKIFILSIKEAAEYFSSDDARKCQGTTYCYAKGTVKSEKNDNCWWWLRTLCDTTAIVAVVDADGPIQYGGTHGGDHFLATGNAVRPALRIELGF